MEAGCLLQPITSDPDLVFVVVGGGSEVEERSAAKRGAGGQSGR